MATSVFGQIKQKVQRSLSPLSSPVGSPKFRRRLAMRMQSPVFAAFSSLYPYSSSNMAPASMADGAIGPDSTYVSKPSTRQKRRKHRRKGGNYDLKAAEEFREVQSEPELESCDMVASGGERRGGMASFLYKRKSSAGASSVIDGSCTVGRTAGKHQVQLLTVSHGFIEETGIPLRT